MNNNINISFVVDNNYFNYMVVTIESIVKNMNKNKKINFYIIDSGIKKNNISFIKKKYSNNSNIRFEFIKVDTNLLLNYKIKTHVSIAAYAKIYISDLLNLEKVIYLDCDLIVNSDISILWNEFDENICLQAVWNPFYNYDNKFLGIEDNARTFNSGVMLLNLKLMREKGMSFQLENFLNNNHDKTKLHDQAAFNAVFRNDWKELDYKWNYQVLMIQSHYSKLNLDKNTYKELYEEPHIIHFNTGSKPWQFRNNHPYKNMYLNKYKKIFGDINYRDVNLNSIIHKFKEFLKYNYFNIINHI